LILHQHGLTLRPITGPDELDLFNSLPYSLNEEVGGDLAAGRRRPEWLWLALRGDRLAARAGWRSQAGDLHPLLMDIFDIDGGTDDGVQLLKTALPAVVPAGATPPEYGRFLPADWRGDQRTRQAVHDRMRALERAGARLFVERLRLEWRPGRLLHTHHRRRPLPADARIDHQIADQAPWVPIYNPHSLVMLSARVGNYQFNPYLCVLIDQLWVR
jgi:hypothetical protein